MASVTSLIDIQRQASDLAKAQGWSQKTPQERLLYLTAEVGEVAQGVIRLQRSECASDDLKRDLAMELYDVIWNVCDLANILGLDLEDAARRKTQINQTRNWGDEHA